MTPERDTMMTLLLSYISLLAERHAYAPDELFEYQLWDDLQRTYPIMVSWEETDELRFLVAKTDSWATYSPDTGMFQLIDIQEWQSLLEKRGH